MPDDPTDPAKLTKEQSEAALAWIKRHFATPRNCPVCRNTNWTLGDRLVAPTPFQADGGWIMGGTAMPMLALICTTCGYTRFFNAVLAGLVKKSPPTGGGPNG